MTTDLLPLPAPRHVGRAVASEDVAKLLERSRILLAAACDSLMEAEGYAPELGPVIDLLDRQIEKVREAADRYDQPELPLAS